MGVGERQASVLRPNGTYYIFECDGPERQYDTVQCCHCGRHWVYMPGSGRTRGWCTQCASITCGREACHRCVPQEARLENWEAGRDTYHRKIAVPVGIDL